MKLKDILAISGKPGLYKFLSQGRNGIIVESFIDQKRMAVQSTNKVSALEDIAIFTETDELPLKDVFKMFFEKEDGQQTISHKSNPEDLKKLFGEILPDYDRDRVYVSDIKKVVNWYNTLVDLELINLEEDDDEESAEEEKESDGEAEAKQEKPGDSDEKEVEEKK